jgi:hypothetical protein
MCISVHNLGIKGDLSIPTKIETIKKLDKGNNPSFIHSHSQLQTQQRTHIYLFSFSHNNKSFFSIRLKFNKLK